MAIFRGSRSDHVKDVVEDGEEACGKGAGDDRAKVPPEDDEQRAASALLLPQNLLEIPGYGVAAEAEVD